MNSLSQNNELAIGNIINGKYKIEKLLGQGGMGQVYLVTHTELNKPFALKVMLLDDEEDPDSKHLLRFRREAKVLAKLNHPNIVAIADFGVTELSKLPYIVMEYINGSSLRTILNTSETLSETTAVNIVKQICAGLNLAHSNGVIHRDLKPENIMVEKLPDNQLIVRILDFGIAKLDSQNQEITTENKSLTEGNIIGTKRYMSPEQFFGSKVDAGTDIYSLNVMLYEMLTGEIPNPLTDTVMPLSIMRTGSTPKLSKIIEKGMSFKRSDRYKDILEFKKELEKFEVDSGQTKREEVETFIHLGNQTSPVSPISQEMTKKISPANITPEIPIIKQAKVDKQIYVVKQPPVENKPPKKFRYLFAIVLIFAILLTTTTTFYFYFYYNQKSTTKKINEDSFQMILIPSNSFIMGNNDDDYSKPAHTVKLNSFEVSRFLITNNQYLEFIKSTNYPYPKEWDGKIPDKALLERPIVNISWNDANNFCKWLSNQTGKDYRLLEEKEWEYIARYSSKFRIEEILSDYVEWTGTVLELYPGSKVELPESLKVTVPRIIRGKDKNIDSDPITFRQWYVSDFKSPKLSFRIACNAKIK